MSRLLTLSLLSILWCHSTLGQTDRMGSSKVHLKTGVRPLGYEFKIDNADESETLLYKPNLNSQIFISATIEDVIGVFWGFKTPNSESDQLRKGSTEYDDWRFSFPYERFRINAYWVRYQGFYIENSSTVDPTWNSSQPYIRNDQLFNQSTGGSLTWIHSPKDFSLIAALDQTDRQKSSGGSWLYGFAINESVFNSDTAMIPTAIQSRFGEDATITEGRFRSLIFQGGYGYTYVPFENWSATLAVQLGFGPQDSFVKGPSFTESNMKTARVVDALLNLGYNGKLFFTGGQLQSNQVASQGRSITLSSGLIEIQFYLGFHL
ncbi:MAG: DUF4421 domain-containing protein [Bdellovibrionales bacterium]|nr:DUF4421 domain-containing protein [Bdellovibrionales bacterium]